MRNTGLEEAQAGTKIARRNISNLRYADDTTLLARTWKQPRCPSADEWIRKLWYIYTMEYHSAIKKNTFGGSLSCGARFRPGPVGLPAGSPLQYSCLENPIDGSPLGSSVPGILQARTLEWVAISFFNA